MKTPNPTHTTETTQQQPQPNIAPAYRFNQPMLAVKPPYHMDLALPMQVLRYDRSECNESRSREMEGCLADNAGKVICYFPTPAALKRARVFAAAPELAEALEAVLFVCDDNEMEGLPAIEEARALLARLQGNGEGGGV